MAFESAKGGESAREEPETNGEVHAESNGVINGEANSDPRGDVNGHGDTNGHIDQTPETNGTLDESEPGSTDVSVIPATTSSSIPATAASFRPSRSSAREAKRLFPGQEQRKLMRIQKQIEYTVERQYAGKEPKLPRSVDLSREGERMYNLNQEKLLRSVDIQFLEAGAASLPPKVFGSPSTVDWLVQQRPPRVFPLSLIRVLPPSRVTVEGFKTLLKLRAQLRDRACMLWAPKRPAPAVAAIVANDGHLKRGAVNKFRRDNFLKVMRKLRKEGGELSSGATESVFSGYGASGLAKKTRKRKREGIGGVGGGSSDEDSDLGDENDETMDKETFIERSLARYESKKEKKAQSRAAAKEEVRAEKRQKKIDDGIVLPVTMAGGVAGSAAGSADDAVSDAAQSNGVGDAGVQTVEVRTKGIGYHQTVQVDEVVEVAKALQRNDKIEDVVALNRSAKNLSVKEMLALKRGKVRQKMTALSFFRAWCISHAQKVTPIE